MDIVSVLLIFFILIGAFYLVKKKIDESTLSEKEKNNKFKDIRIKTSSIKTKNVNSDNKFLFYINRCLGNYANFDGTATRGEFWYFYLFILIISAITIVIDYFFFIELADKFGMGLISSIATLLLIIPQVSVSSRRLHDIGKSGWWILINFTIIGIIVLFVWYATKSNPKLNKKYK